MGSGTDVALETADAAVLHGRVSDVARMVDLSKRTMINILQNIAVVLGLKAVSRPSWDLRGCGQPFAPIPVQLLVTLNALRLLPLPNP